jgi:HTH-type transcriptional regulator/antitoxin HigA
MSDRHRGINNLPYPLLLHSFMEDHQLKSKDLVEILGVSKGYISEILHYKKG